MSKNVEGLVEMDSQVHAFCCTMGYLVHIACMTSRILLLIVLTVGVLIYTVIFQGNLLLVSGHQCCEICAKACGCQQEICKEPAILVLDAAVDENLSSESVRSVEENDKVHLRTELFNYMKNLLLQNSSGAVASVNIMHEFTPLQIEQVLDNCDKIKTLQHVETFVEVWRREHRRAILSAIHQVFGDVHSSELETPESEDEDIEEFAQEWADIRDDSELCQLLSESDLLIVDVHMEDIDQSGNEQ